MWQATVVEVGPSRDHLVGIHWHGPKKSTRKTVWVVRDNILSVDEVEAVQAEVEKGEDEVAAISGTSAGGWKGSTGTRGS